MNLVEQELVDGCAVACYAMFTSTNYWDALKVLHPRKKAGDYTAFHQTSNEVLLEALGHAGFTVTPKTPRPLDQLKSAVLVVRYLIGTEMFMHTVVWDAEKQEVLDPFDSSRPLQEYQDGLCFAFELVLQPPVVEAAGL